jgi:uncharacterized damage-inducible protein DinB
MLQMVRDLIAHKGHADAAVLSAIRQDAAAASDPELVELLHHVLLANRFWLLSVRGLPFDFEAESRASVSFDDLIQRFRTTQVEETAWVGGATDADLARALVNSSIPGGSCTVAQAVVQVCLHSHGHRAQCAKLFRRHGGEPPRTDFILWLAERPTAEWTIPPEALAEPDAARDTGTSTA